MVGLAAIIASVLLVTSALGHCPLHQKLGYVPASLRGATMSVPRDHQTDTQKGHQGHSVWMMIACCVPMLAIAVVLVVTGVLSPGFLLAAVACVVMVAAMMRGNGQGGGDSDT